MLWKDVVGFEGLYKISEYGDIQSSYKSMKILKPKKDKDGYSGVSLSKNGKAHHLRVHRLVAMAFLDNLENHPIVNHKDLDVTNNHYSNLEWCTFVHNTKHYYDNALDKRTLSSLSKDELLSLVTAYHSGKSHKQLCFDFNLDCRPDAISEVVTGRRFSELTGIVRSCDFKQRTTEKITDEDVYNMLNEYHNLNISQTKLCIKYGMSPAQVSRIVNGTRRSEVYNNFFAQAASS
jgi:hypothetical protein